MLIYKSLNTQIVINTHLKTKLHSGHFRLLKKTINNFPVKTSRVNVVESISEKNQYTRFIGRFGKFKGASVRIVLIDSISKNYNSIDIYTDFKIFLNGKFAIRN